MHTWVLLAVLLVGTPLLAVNLLRMPETKYERADMERFGARSLARSAGR